MLHITTTDYEVNLDEQDLYSPELDEDGTPKHKNYFLTPFATSREEEGVLEDISPLAEESKRLANFSEALEALLKQVNKEYDCLTSGIMPSIMAKNKVATYTLENGVTVKSKTSVYASLPKEDSIARERALKWINEQGGGGLIKDKLVVESPTQDLIDSVKGKFPMERLQDIHPSTLKAFVTDLLGYKKGSVARATEDEVPPELHVYIKNTVTVK